MRKSTIFLLFISFWSALLALTFVHARRAEAVAGPGRAERARLVGGLGLTDLCLFTEARYTRNPSMADMHAPFQDHPGALEHFPSGTLVTPPAYIPGAD